MNHDEPGDSPGQLSVDLEVERVALAHHASPGARHTAQAGAAHAAAVGSSLSCKWVSPAPTEQGAHRALIGWKHDRG